MDPVELLRRRLEEEDCRPHGPEGRLRARCPAHQGEREDALAVTVGADGRALVTCHRGCTAEQVVAALGLRMRDLFPGGHRNGPRYRPLPLQRSEFKGVELELVNFLHDLVSTNTPYQLMITSDCPACGAQGGWLRASSFSLSADCPEGCDTDSYLQAIRSRL